MAYLFHGNHPGPFRLNGILSGQAFSKTGPPCLPGSVGGTNSLWKDSLYSGSLRSLTPGAFHTLDILSLLSLLSLLPPYQLELCREFVQTHDPMVFADVSAVSDLCPTVQWTGKIMAIMVLQERAR